MDKRIAFSCVGFLLLLVIALFAPVDPGSRELSEEIDPVVGSADDRIPEELSEDSDSRDASDAAPVVLVEESPPAGEALGDDGRTEPAETSFDQVLRQWAGEFHMTELKPADWPEVAKDFWDPDSLVRVIRDDRFPSGEPAGRAVLGGFYALDEEQQAESLRYQDLRLTEEYLCKRFKHEEYLAGRAQGPFSTASQASRVGRLFAVSPSGPFYSVNMERLANSEVFLNLVREIEEQRARISRYAASTNWDPFLGSQ